jgi:type I site-specific restriction endonuclease
MEDKIVKVAIDYSLIRYIHKRIKNNKNFLCTITGPTGSGKSWTALSIGEQLDKDFNVTRVIFKARELMKLINDGNLKPGSVLIWDEAGIDLSNRNWQSVTNKMLNALLQTFRHKNFILFFTVPYSDFIDTASKKLFHADFETQRINKEDEVVVLKPKLLQYNSNYAKWYRKYLKISSHGKIVKIRRWKVPKPSEELIKEYEIKKNLFTKSLNKEIDKQLEELEPQQKKIKEIDNSIETNTIKKKLNTIDEQILMLHNQGKSLREIGEIVGYKSAQTVLTRLRSIKEKNELIDSYKEAIRREALAPKLIC